MYLIENPGEFLGFFYAKILLGIIMNIVCHVYILKCADDSYYVGRADNIESRMIAHQTKAYDYCYTASRLLVELIFVKEFATRDEAFNFERQIKGWSRAKKEALIQGGLEAVKAPRKENKQIIPCHGGAAAGLYRTTEQLKNLFLNQYTECCFGSGLSANPAYTYSHLLFLLILYPGV